MIFSRDFYRDAVGFDKDARVGVTVYAAAYWFGGSITLTTFNLLIGLFITAATLFSMKVVTQEKLLYFPAILISAGFVMRGLITAFFGMIPLMVVAVLFVSLPRFF